jgi:PEP-CTERM motif
LTITSRVPCRSPISNFQGVKPDGLPDSSLTSGAATGIFSQYPNTNSGAIGLNGLYYSFMLKAIAPGSGAISFDPTLGANEYAANETGFNYAPLITNGNLSFTIGQASVPEPSSLCMIAIGGAAIGHRLLARKRAAV